MTNQLMTIEKPDFLVFLSIKDVHSSDYQTSQIPDSNLLKLLLQNFPNYYVDLVQDFVARNVLNAQLDVCKRMHSLIQPLIYAQACCYQSLIYQLMCLFVRVGFSKTEFLSSFANQTFS